MGIDASDLNGNGIPDHREPWFWKAVWGGLSFLVTTFASPHTVVYRRMAEVDPKVRAALDAALQARGVRP